MHPVQLRRLTPAIAWLAFLAFPLPALSQTVAQAPPTGSQAAGALRDGQHDFDFKIGTWTTHIRKLQKPLSGSSTWIDFNGTVVVRKVWDGRAALEEIEADAPTGHFEGLTLFLYNATAHQWSLNFADGDGGTFNQPCIGFFHDGRGEFIDQEIYRGRAILVRIIWSDITPTSHRFEQSFSDNEGKTWETNFTATLTRASDSAGSLDYHTTEMTRENHDFDWQLGQWKLNTSRLEHPLKEGGKWIALMGTVDVEKVWGGRANLAEIHLDGASSHLEFLSLRLYNPNAHQWSLNFASSGDATLSTPMVGQFKNGRGEFYDQEVVGDRSMLVRFVFDGLTSGETRDEQAFSADGGKTWKVNWINKQARVSTH
jgi:hypothetical protein